MKMPLPDMTCQLKTANCYPKTDYRTKEVVVDKDGNKFYKVKAQVANGKNTEDLEFTVKAKENPLADMNALDMVTFSGVQISFGVFEKHIYVAQDQGADNAAQDAIDENQVYKQPKTKAVKYCTLSAEKVKRV